MGAEAGSSLLMHVGLLGAGYVLGRVQLLPLAVEFYYELYELSVARKALLAWSLVLLICVYVVFFFIPLRKIADLEASKSHEHGSATASPTSFRRELRRRGSYSMSYVTDIKAHVFARTETL